MAINKWIIAAASMLFVLTLIQCNKEEQVPATSSERFDSKRNSATDLSTPFVGPPKIHITVVADGFVDSAADKARIDYFYQNTFGALTEIAPFNRVKGELIFDAPIRTKPDTSGESRLGLQPIEDGCYFQFDDGFYDKLEEAKGNISPTALTIVLMNVDTSKRVGACAIGKDLIITSPMMDARALAHEFGHSIGGLRDETNDRGFVFAALTSKPHSEPNCSDNPTSPGWIVATSETAVQQPKAGCEGFASGLFRPTNSCRMRDPDSSDFDCVCTEHILRHLSALLHKELERPQNFCRVLTPPAQAATAGPAAGNLFTVDFKSLKESKIVKIEAVESFSLRPELIGGSVFASLKINGTVVAAESLPDEPQNARAYPPGKPQIHKPADAPIPTRIQLFVPSKEIPSSPKFETDTITFSGLSGLKVLDKQVLDKLTQTANTH